MPGPLLHPGAVPGLRRAGSSQGPGSVPALVQARSCLAAVERLRIIVARSMTCIRWLAEIGPMEPEQLWTLFQIDQPRMGARLRQF